ncbi:RES domain-containing protein [Curtobacterium sp. ME12]|uniref:RES domain-containing protein n=1 Tax=Curtobacterium sp. ME12 TaxID=2744253 RepID=UPI0015F4D24C|nr:RES domain-containing protein [Curtobacterium sp. ME12]
MGAAKDHQQTVWDRGWEDVDQTICVGHLLEPFLREAVGAPDREECSLCGRTSDGERFAIDLAKVMEIFMPTFWLFYGRYSESPSFDNTTVELEDTATAVYDVGSGVFGDEVEESVLGIITDAIPDTEVSVWDPWMSSLPLRLQWDRFERIAQHGSRFIVTGGPASRSPLSTIQPFLEELLGYVDGPHHLVATMDSLIYRGRLLRDPQRPFVSAADLGAPPAAIASAGRMSPAGIPAFYGSADVDTAVAEIAAHDVQEYAQVAAWKPSRPLRILDLTGAPLTSPSAFDPSARDTYRRLRFLREFAAAVAQPIVPDGRQHSEYAPTQILTEWFRWVPDTQLDGIAFASAQTGGKNYAIFIEAAEIALSSAVPPLSLVPSPASGVYRALRTVTASPVNFGY